MHSCSQWSPTHRSIEKCTRLVSTLSLNLVFSFLILSLCSKLQHLEVLQGQVVIISTEGVLKLNSDVVEATPDNAADMSPERLSPKELIDIYHLNGMDSGFWSTSSHHLCVPMEDALP